MAETARKKSSLNFITSLFGQALTIGLGILVPRLFVLSFGSEVNGFISSINQIFVYVGLLEAGVGTASLQALYAPVGRKDRDSVNAILAATHRFYKRTGFLYLIVISLIALIYPLCVDSSLNYVTMATIILVIGAGGAFPYFLQAKYAILLNADGKSYVLNTVTQIRSVALSLCRVGLLLAGANVILVESSYLAIGLLQSFVIILYIRKKYSWIDLKTKPDFTAISQRKSVLVHQISTLIFSNTDILLLTFFCDLKTVSIYTMHKYLFGFVATMINIFSSSIGFRLGQVYQNRPHFLKLHNIYETFHITLSFALMTVAYLFIRPFLTLYTAGMDINYILPYLPLLFYLMELLDCGRGPTLNVITYAGHFKQTQWRSVVESAINLGSSLILVQFFGINGVVMGTVLALLYRTNDIIIYTNRKLLDRSPWHTYRIWLVNILFSLASIFLFHTLSLNLSKYFYVIFAAGVMCVVIVPLQLAVNYLINHDAGKALFAELKMWKRKKKINTESDS